MGFAAGLGFLVGLVDLAASVGVGRTLPDSADCMRFVLGSQHCSWRGQTRSTPRRNRRSQTIVEVAAPGVVVGVIAAAGVVVGVTAAAAALVAAEVLVATVVAAAAVVEVAAAEVVAAAEEAADTVVEAATAAVAEAVAVDHLHGRTY